MTTVNTFHVPLVQSSLEVTPGSNSNGYMWRSSDGCCRPQQAIAGCDQINALVKERTELRRQKKWAETDRLKLLLQTEPYKVELFDRSDGVTVWRRVGEKTKPLEKRISWTSIGYARSFLDFPSQKAARIPLVIATVDTPHYRKRLQETIDHFSNQNEAPNKGVGFAIHSVDMLDLNKNINIGPKRIVFEGWRQVLLPHLMELCSETEDGFVVVVEDDVRLPSAIRPCHIRQVCISSFQDDPNVNILSLGHAWSPAKPSRRQRRRLKRQKEQQQKQQQPSANSNDDGGVVNEVTNQVYCRGLLNHLESGGGIHGATMLAIRTPDGLTSLVRALNGVTQAGKRTHFDQFLFHSTLHNVGLALVDPPLAGWAEVSETLTSVGHGQRRVGGGRLEHLPNVETDKDSTRLSSYQLIVRKFDMV